MKKLLAAPLFVLLFVVQSVAAPTLGGATSPDGKTKVTIDLPAAMRAVNVGGRDGAGLCVFTSIMHAARWQHEGMLEDLQSLMRKELGGGWPEKVDLMLKKYAASADYFQYEGIDPISIKAALASNRLPSVTYNGRDPHYRGWISHMVNCVHYDDTWVAILDNNFIGENDIVWMTPAEFQDRWRGRGSGWVVVLLKETPEQLPCPNFGNDVVPVAKVEKTAAGKKRLFVDGGWTEPCHYTWYYYHKKDPAWLYLYYENETFVGAYHLGAHEFYFWDYDENRWLSPCESPFDLPKWFYCDRTGIVGEAEDYGIPLHFFPPRGPADERWTRKGQPAGKADLLKLLQPKPRPAPVPTPDPTPAGPDVTGPAVISTLLIACCFFARKERP